MTCETRCKGCVHYTDGNCPADRLERFENAVRDMREWQRAYFKSRNAEALRRAKEAEKKVDEMIGGTK